MYKLIKNKTDLIQWMKKNDEIYLISGQKDIRERLFDDVGTFDSLYGKERDLEGDLGGYVIILYGDDVDRKEWIQELLDYHHLTLNDREYEDVFEVVETNTKVSFQLFLCSSDYAVEIVTLYHDKE